MGLRAAAQIEGPHIPSMIRFENKSLNPCVLPLLIKALLCKPLEVSASDDHSNKPEGLIVSGNKMYININSPIQNVIKNPSFKGFGQFILPLDNRTYDETDRSLLRNFLE